MRDELLLLSFEIQEVQSSFAFVQTVDMFAAQARIDRKSKKSTSVDFMSDIKYKHLKVSSFCWLIKNKIC